MAQNLQMLLAMQDDDFQIILENDPIIKQLEKAKYSEHDQYWELMTVFSGKNELGNLVFNSITLGLWSFLYSIKNPYVIGESKKQKKDTDVFLYLLHHGFQGLKDTLFEDSKDFCLKSNISYIQAEVYILQMIALSFRPMEMLTCYKKSSQPTRFNLQWLTSIISIVHKQCGCDRLYIMYKMSLLQIMYYVVNNLKQNDIHNKIKRKNSDQINAEIFKRTYELGQLYYNSKYK